nr:MAG: putative coat protein [Partitiviridae sp.]
MSSRNLDKQSGKNRVTLRRPRPPPQTDIESEPEITQSESEQEEEMNVPRRFESQRPKPKESARPPKARPQPKTKTPGRSFEREAEEIDEPSKPSDKPTAGYALALTAALRIGLASITQQTQSEYVPSCEHYGWAMWSIAQVIADNIALHDKFVGYTSTGFFLYCSYLWMYQYLLVREDAQVPEFYERRCLRALRQIAPPEAWTVPTPLVPFLQFLGSCKPEGGFYDRIVPRINIRFDELSSGDRVLLTHLNAITGISRIPNFPALVQFLHNIGSGTAAFSDADRLYPLENHELAANNTFLGITASDLTTAGEAQRSFFAMIMSGTWSPPTETPHSSGNMDLDMKRSRIKQWEVPDLEPRTGYAGCKLSNLQDWMCLDNNPSKNRWIIQLVNLGSTVCRFFPGSVNLASIPLATMTETFVRYHDHRTISATYPLKDHAWYQAVPRAPDDRIHVVGYINREESGPLIKQSVSVAIRQWITFTDATQHRDKYFRVRAGNAHDGADITEVGPYFKNLDADMPSTPLPLVESTTKDPPERLFLPFIHDNLYDNLGGVAQRH